MYNYQDIIDYIISKGAEYADIRVHLSDITEKISIINQSLDYNYETKSGYGIRVLNNGSWGFASSEDTKPENIQKTADKALENALESSKLSKYKIQLSPKQQEVASYTTPTQTDPFELELSEKIKYLMQVNKDLEDPLFEYATTEANFYKREILYIDSEGSHITRNILDIHAFLSIDAKDSDQKKVTRNFDLYQLKEGTVGWENLLSKEQFNQASRLKNELKNLMVAPECESEICDIILLPEMMALQTHETIGHALELDRILGYELSYAGGSHISLEDFGKKEFGSKKLFARADGTSLASPGSTGFDDDGVPSQNVLMIEAGILKDAISSRQMVMEANTKANKTIFKKSGGSSRAESYNCMPIDRMNNINIDPGKNETLQTMISSCKNGLIIESPSSWSIGSNRENFHFAAQIAWKIIDGKISHIVKNPTYSGDSMKFWKSLDKVGDESTWQMQQVFNCGKGQPNQVMRLGHGIPICLFKNVQVGN